MFLVKTIVRSRWDHGPVTAPGEMPADAITDLKTTGNTLSFWTSEQADESALLDAVIGVAAGRDAIAKIEVWFVRRTELEAEGFSTKASPGKTPVVHLRERHVDVVDIDVDCLTKLMMRIDQTLEERHKSVLKEAGRASAVCRGAGGPGRAQGSEREAQAPGRSCANRPGRTRLTPRWCLRRPGWPAAP
jgi:hypothetical protein